MIKKEECNTGIKAIINNNSTKWNDLMGTTKNGLVCFPFNSKGVLMGEELELIPGTKIEIMDKPKRHNDNGNQIKFKIDGSEIIMSAWWINFKHKVDKI